ncbi:NAD(P)H-dependent oxidoreductase [Flavobacteriaceae bacterium SZ-1-7]|uniref:NADPH-dependent FMN reductase n=1 Tax=Tamlana sedimenti TaxID=3134126 RepID=UPI003121CBAD
MKKIIAFAGSNSKNSINKQLATYASGLVIDAEVDILDLNDFKLPLFGVDLEKQLGGQPENAHKFLNRIKESDGIVLSLAEHNGAYATVFKNLLDWMSRIESKTFFGKPMLLMATSTGGRGGKSVLSIAQNRFPYHNANIVDVFSLPLFNDNFSSGKISNEELNEELKSKVKAFQEAL